MRSSVAWKNHSWVSIEDAQLSLDDWGVVQGVVIVDRLRTCNHRLLDLELHLNRLKSNCHAIGIAPEGLGFLPEIIDQCARRNRARFGDQDFGIVVLATPGLCGTTGPPTIIIHVQPLNWPMLASWYEGGQELIIATARNVPAPCWSPQLKTRARLHYYLADRQAASESGKYAGALLLDTNGFVTETSSASVIVIDDQGRLCCPPEEAVLGSISLNRTLRLAHSIGLKVVRQPIIPSQLATAREILLTGTSGCLWPASKCVDREFAKSTLLPVYLELRDRWIADIGLDYVAQARLFSHN